ncbi:MAG: hypothetical protein ACI4TX_02020 [Christensenellales bacterium]
MKSNNAYKKQNATLMALALGVILMLVITTVLSFAYFTSSKQSGDQTLTFDVLEIDSSDTALNGFTISSNDGHAKILPGCIMEIQGKIQLTATSNVDAFVRMKPNISITLKGDVPANADQISKFTNLFNGSFISGASSVWKMEQDS